ncbi:hypothetical protein AB0E75_02415 [Streptomyces griseoviridis]|uniref:Toxin-antitoxin system HicB family antitoxin n=3 Tax=Streptomyces TaxID=1883 RepID=A0ABT9LL75_STRGD|nr:MULTISPECIES: hypothetical protein [Streptomyces]MDP9683841.1 hypothetical protein [Streptomyces griseoviridis]GGS25895.1 hypothetical protein GCM10010238_12760 [Streptomyces niveoruber]GGS86335.1 hypothetical protein GCM10010240_19780 [Streptomyces griseoviridis]GGU40940.1 hypothetical protein GCM10010259_34800 [Streptomyces daghestanicus]GHI31208.1 hypothetical protein Sdagh_29380 [Streptomyces daghestanicus]
MTGEPEESGAAGGGEEAVPRRRPRARKQVLLRLDPAVYDALARWAGDELRSANAQIEFLLRRSLAEAGRLPGDTGPLPRRGRPPAAGRGRRDAPDEPPPPVTEP